ncbi:Proteasome subunit alpha type-3 [Ataeniobius toweri]|uniref:Proteasome subunit alpha type-3 n=1 Tax=Ataeniobius toweri TaxID=208326 RepID=A0ABU7AMW6_9TELE|nr:Proteasome subunit alpha type-3 [Ataeniobius toweri]
MRGRQSAGIRVRCGPGNAGRLRNSAGWTCSGAGTKIMREMTCRELVKEVAKIIYIVHDEVKDKAFELELSWVGEVTNGRHELVPKDIKEEAEKYAKDSLEEEDDSDEDNM